MIHVKKSKDYFKDNTKNAFLCWLDVQDFEILSDVVKVPMHEKPPKLDASNRHRKLKLKHLADI